MLKSSRFAVRFDLLYRGHETPYMHVVVYHSVEMMIEHSCIADLSQEGENT